MAPLTFVSAPLNNVLVKLALGSLAFVKFFRENTDPFRLHPLQS